MKKSVNTFGVKPKIQYVQVCVQLVEPTKQKKSRKKYIRSCGFQIYQVDYEKTAKAVREVCRRLGEREI